MKSLASLLCLVLAAVAFSCNDDDLPSNASDNLIVLQGRYFGWTENQIIVVTDPAGKLLSTHKSTNGLDTPIKPPLSGYGGSLINLYLINQHDSMYTITAFMNLRRGSEFIGPYFENPWPESTPSKLNLKNVRSFETLTLSTDLYGWSTNQQTESGSIDIYYHAGPLYSQVVSNGSGYYGFFDVDKQSGVTTIDGAELNKRSTKVTIELGPDVVASSYSLNAAFDSESVGWNYQLYSTWGESSIDVYYPDEPFAKYQSAISYVADGHSYSEYRNDTSPNFKFDRIPFDGAVTNTNPKNFHLETSGTFDYYVATYRSWSHSSNLIVYSSQRYNEFQIPDFSSIAGVREFPFSDLESVTVEMVDFDGLEEISRDFRFFTSGHFPVPRNKRTNQFTKSVD